MQTEWEARAAERLRAHANADGGYGPRPAQPSEPEPTALAAMALDDESARGWLAAHQSPTGSFTVVNGFPSTAATPLGALALPAGSARERALDALAATRAQPAEPRGWGWTPTTYGWVEPTAWAVLALKRLRPRFTRLIADGERVLAARECVGGGWNYGNRSVLGGDLPPYVQTSAAAALALQATNDTGLAERARQFVASHWHTERGGLTLAVSLAALRVHGLPEASAAATAVGEQFERTGFLDDTVALAWAVLAAGEGVTNLQVSSP